MLALLSHAGPRERRRTNSGSTLSACRCFPPVFGFADDAHNWRAHHPKRDRSYSRTGSATTSRSRTAGACSATKEVVPEKIRTRVPGSGTGLVRQTYCRRSNWIVYFRLAAVDRVLDSAQYERLQAIRCFRRDASAVRSQPSHRRRPRPRWPGRRPVCSGLAMRLTRSWAARGPPRAFQPGLTPQCGSTVTSNRETGCPRRVDPRPIPARNRADPSVGWE